MLLLLCAQGCVPADGQDRQVLGFYAHWMRPAYPHTDIPFDHLTHISHAFVWPNADGSLHVPDDLLYPELIEAAHAQGVRVVIAVGGWGHSHGFSPMTANPASRRRFVEALVAFCEAHGYDGVDLDWEFPSLHDRGPLVLLAQELRAALQAARRTLTLSITLPPVDREQGYDARQLSDLMDWMSVMTYDFHGDWSDHSGHNAPLYATGRDQDGAVDESVRYWLGKGILPAKLNIGLAFYGRLFQSAQLYGPGSGGTPLSFAEVHQRQTSGWRYHWDQAAGAPYLQDPASALLVTYDDTASVRMKAGYVQTHDLRGVIIWALGQDKVPPNDQPLLRTVGRYLLPSRTLQHRGGQTGEHDRGVEESAPPSSSPRVNVPASSSE